MLHTLLQVVPTREHALFKQLFADITQFDDFRYFNAELGRNGPEFRLKATGEGLW